MQNLTTPHQGWGTPQLYGPLPACRWPTFWMSSQQCLHHGQNISMSPNVSKSSRSNFSCHCSATATATFRLRIAHLSALALGSGLAASCCFTIVLRCAGSPCFLQGLCYCRASEPLPQVLDKTDCANYAKSLSAGSGLLFVHQCQEALQSPST